MFWYDGSWKETQELFVWNGAWTPVQECYIWDGSNWRLTFTAPSYLNSFSICDVNCNPTDGTFRASWTYTAGTPSNWKIRLEYSFNYGSSYTVFDDNIDITTSPFTDSLNGVSGFTSLDDTYFKLSMVDSSGGTVHAINSPRFAYPAFSCC